MPGPQVALEQVQIGEIPGPVSLTCDTGQSVWSVVLRDVDTGVRTTIQLCVTDGVAPCDPGGVLANLILGGYEFVDDPCP